MRPKVYSIWSSQLLFTGSGYSIFRRRTMKITNKKAAKVVANRKAPHVGRSTLTTGGLFPSPTASKPRRTREVMTPLILTIWAALLGKNGRNGMEGMTKKEEGIW
jgi:hypothetical protein